MLRMQMNNHAERRRKLAKQRVGTTALTTSIACHAEITMSERDAHTIRAILISA